MQVTRTAQVLRPGQDVIELVGKFARDIRESNPREPGGLIAGQDRWHKRRGSAGAGAASARLRLRRCAGGNAPIEISADVSDERLDLAVEEVVGTRDDLVVD